MTMDINYLRTGSHPVIVPRSYNANKSSYLSRSGLKDSETFVECLVCHPIRPKRQLGEKFKIRH